MLAAIRLASSLLSNLAASPPRLLLIINVAELLPGAVRHHESGADVLDRPRRREAVLVFGQLRSGCIFESRIGQEDGALEWTHCFSASLIMPALSMQFISIRAADAASLIGNFWQGIGTVASSPHRHFLSRPTV
jgi:hypothetical protein